jgi:23S rRNA (adenine-N6)-dimethyltransferase
VTARVRSARSARDLRRRRLGQNFLRPELAEQLVDDAGFRPDELVLEIGAGLGALTCALARRPLDVVAVELDPSWAARLRERLRGCARVRVAEADFLSLRLPARPFRVIGSPPFARTTELLARLLDDPRVPLARADLVVQWEVARKRAAVPPETLRSALWAPWWELRVARRIRASAFRPVPRVDAGMLVVLRREPPLLPAAMAHRYADFVRAHWPFEAAARAER